MDFANYDPGRLGLGGGGQFARQAWAFLNKPDIMQGMTSATELGHPAVAGIREALVARFGDRMLIERNRQRIGHMVRQIMERGGYEIDQHNVKVNLFPFSKAARYRRKDAVLLHVFRATTDARELAITARRRDSAKLPAAPHGGRWTYWTQITSKLQAAVALGITNLSGVNRKIAQDGFALHRVPRMMRPSNP